jgi:hypothetical protein
MPTSTRPKLPRDKNTQAAAALPKKRSHRVQQASAGKTVTKAADNKGRVALGIRFANRSVIIDQLNETEVIVKLARLIPEREAWLYENAEALNAVREGLAQARAGKLTEGPNIDADAKLAAKLLQD